MKRGSESFEHEHSTLVSRCDCQLAPFALELVPRPANQDVDSINLAGIIIAQCEVQPESTSAPQSLKILTEKAGTGTGMLVARVYCREIGQKPV